MSGVSPQFLSVLGALNSSEKLSLGVSPKAGVSKALVPSGKGFPKKPKLKSEKLNILCRTSVTTCPSTKPILRCKNPRLSGLILIIQRPEDDVT